MKLAPRGHLQVLSRTDGLALLASASVGRLGVSSGALPAILPPGGWAPTARWKVAEGALQECLPAPPCGR